MGVYCDDLIVSPHYHDMWVTLEASQGALSRGAIISIDPVSYQVSSSDVVPKSDANANKFYVHGGNSGSATRPFGVLLDDVAQNSSAQSVHILVTGSVSRAKIDAVNGQGSPKAITAALLNDLRYAGIICK